MLALCSDAFVLNTYDFYVNEYAAFSKKLRFCVKCKQRKAQQIISKSLDISITNSVCFRAHNC